MLNIDALVKSEKLFNMAKNSLPLSFQQCLLMFLVFYFPPPGSSTKL